VTDCTGAVTDEGATTLAGVSAFTVPTGGTLTFDFDR
jgi:hypothetical protein